MGHISLNNGKWIIPVPWRTGTYYSQKRIQEFIGVEGIKQEMHGKLKRKITPLKNLSTTDGKQSKSELLPRHSVHLDTCDEPSVSYKQVLNSIDKPTDYFKYQAQQEQIKRKTQRQKEQEEKRIPEVNHFFTSKQIREINKKLHTYHKPKSKPLPLWIKLSPLFIYKSLQKPKVETYKWSMTGNKGTGMSDSAFKVSELLDIKESTKSEQSVEPVITPPTPEKPTPFWKSKLEQLSSSSVPETSLKVGIALLLFLIPLAFIIVGGFIFTALFMPEWLVGGIAYLPKTVDSNIALVNTTNTTTTFIINSTVPSKPGNQPIIVNLPTTPTKPIQVITPPSSQPSTTQPATQPSTQPTPPIQFKDPSGKVRNIDELTSLVKWQINSQCYWDLRDKGFGKGLDVEYACNSMDTGLWIEACTCCKSIGRCK